MISSKNKIALIIGFLLLIVLLLWAVGGISNDKKIEIFRSNNWNRKYQLKDKDPYGLFLFNEILAAHLDSNHSVKNINKWSDYDSLVNKKEKSTYIFIGQDFQLLNNEIDTLLKDVENGSDLMISFYDLTSNLYDRFFNYIDFDYDYSDSIVVYANNLKYTMYNIHQTDTVAMKWEAFVNETLIDSSFETLSSFMEMSNFIKIKRGKGHIFLHANPQFYFNHQVLRNDGFYYSNFTINQFSKQRNVYWLELGRKMDNEGKENTSVNEGKDSKKDDSLLQLFFKNPSLLWTMLTAIFGFILFIIFRAKRMRPLVPLIPPKRNMTTAFADTITSIYYQNHSPYGILKVQRKNFYHAIHKHFYIDLTRRNEDLEIRILAEKSNVSIESLKELLALIETTESYNVDEHYIANVATQQREFYLKTGIISNFILNRIEKKDRIFNRIIWLPMLLILFGIMMILVGFYYLTQSIGMGVILWPIGISWITIAVLQLKKPLVEITNEQLILYPIFGKKKTYNWEDLVDAVNGNSATLITFSGNRIIKINYWEMSRFDKSSFQQYISNLHKFE
jgi:hypothetical protein